jgi:hypothetical protein|tara:strand:+ start:499 stop:747 length:249 start_codon:yes stop_codon:yes gene_type:complete
METEYNEKKIIEEEKKFFKIIEELARDPQSNKFSTTTKIAKLATLYTYIKSSKVVPVSHVKPLILAIYHDSRKLRSFSNNSE